MLKFFMLTSLFMGANAFAAPILDEDEQFELLQSIDNICGDTWCEGDANWSFDAIQCDTETGCVLDLTMKPYDFSDQVTLAERRFKCDLPDFNTRQGLVERTNRGLQYTPELFEALGDCIFDLTDNFGPMYVAVDSACRSLFNSEKAVSHTIELKGENEGLDAALHALSRLVREKSKTDSSCSLETLPYYRDRAFCRESSVNEICTIPTVNGSYRIRRNLETNKVIVRYFPTKK